MKEAFDKLLNQVVSLTGDAEKAATGNKSARVRLRNGMQVTKSLAQSVRQAVLIDPTTKEEQKNEGQ